MNTQPLKVSIDLSCADVIGSARMIFLVSLEDAVAGLHSSVEQEEIVRMIRRAQNDTAMTLYGTTPARAALVTPQCFAAESVEVSRARVRLRQCVLDLLERIKKHIGAEIEFAITITNFHGEEEMAELVERALRSWQTPQCFKHWW